MKYCNYRDVTSVYSLNSRKLPGHFSYGLGTRLLYQWKVKLHYLALTWGHSREGCRQEFIPIRGCNCHRVSTTTTVLAVWRWQSVVNMFNRKPVQKHNMFSSLYWPCEIRTEKLCTWIYSYAGLPIQVEWRLDHIILFMSQLFGFSFARSTQTAVHSCVNTVVSVWAQKV